MRLIATYQVAWCVCVSVSYDRELCKHRFSDRDATRSTRNHALDGDAHWRRLANTIKRFLRNGDATLCKITSTIRSYFSRCLGIWASNVVNLLFRLVLQCSDRQLSCREMFVFFYKGSPAFKRTFVHRITPIVDDRNGCKENDQCGAWKKLLGQSAKCRYRNYETFSKLVRIKTSVLGLISRWNS